MDATKIVATNKIVVTASPEEWQGIINQLSRMGRNNAASESLINWLINQGVYDQ